MKSVGVDAAFLWSYMNQDKSVDLKKPTQPKSCEFKFYSGSYHRL